MRVVVARCTDISRPLASCQPKYVVTLDGVRIQAASSAGSSTTQQPPQLPAAPQSPSFFADKSKTSTEQAGALPMNMNIGQIFDFKVRQSFHTSFCYSA